MARELELCRSASNVGYGMFSGPHDHEFPLDGKHYPVFHLVLPNRLRFTVFFGTSVPPDSKADMRVSHSATAESWELDDKL